MAKHKEIRLAGPKLESIGLVCSKLVIHDACLKIWHLLSTVEDWSVKM